MSSKRPCSRDAEILARATTLSARPPAATEADYGRLDAEWDGSADHGHLVNTLIQGKQGVLVHRDDFRDYREKKYS